MSVAVMPGWRWPVSSTPTMSGRRIHAGAAQHDGFGLQAAHAHGDHAQRIHVRGVAVGAHAGVGEGHAIA